jgi:hypothetical protein
MSKLEKTNYFNSFMYAIKKFSKLFIFPNLCVTVKPPLSTKVLIYLRNYFRNYSSEKLICYHVWILPFSARQKEVNTTSHLLGYLNSTALEVTGYSLS